MISRPARKPRGPSRTARFLLAAAAVQCLILSIPLSPGYGAPEPGAPRASYHTYESMTQELRALEAGHPDMVRLESLGRTYEDRDIWAVKLSDDVRTNDSAEPDVLIMGGLHAREIMGVEVPLYVLNYLLGNYGTNETCTMLVNTREIWFVPMANPDGHVYVERGNDWRKNRRPTVGGNIGVDLNRNWGYMFGVDGQTSDSPSSEVYHGPYPFSENETRAISELAIRQRFATSLSLHSHGQLILYPWGYTTDPAPDSEELDRMARAMAAINGYTPEQSSRLYPTHGDSEDWLYANTSTLAFTFELDTSFYPPESQIEATCGLNREAVIYLIAYPQASILDAGVVAIASPTSGALVEPDRPLNITARVMNFGTAPVEVPVEMEVSSADGYLHTNSTTVSLRPGQTGEAALQWLLPFAGPENYTLRVRTNLSGDSYGWNDERTIAFKIRTKYGAALSALETARECFPGQSAVYTLNVTSLSNREDDILLELEGARRDWAGIVDRVHLPPAGSAEVNLTVRVPREATPGERVHIAVRALSSTGLGASGLVPTVTTVLDPAPTADAGPDISVNVTEEVEFDGSGSTTPAGSLVRYSWEFGDGGTGEGARVKHAYSRRGVYAVNLTVESDLGWSDTDSLTVRVLQSFGLSLEANSTKISPAPGETVAVGLTLTNLGNGPDEAELRLDALKWSASLDVTRISLQRGESTGIRLSITAPERALAGSTALFRVTAASLESPYASDEVLVTATVAEVRGLRLSLEDSRRAVNDGRSAVFTALVENLGNVNDTLDFEAAGVPEGWAVSFSRQNLTLAPWSNASVEIIVSVPPGALAGEYGLSVNGIGLEVLVRARHGLSASVAPPVATTKPGESALFSLKFTNTGNAPDSFTIEVSGLPEGWDSGLPLPPSGVAPGANGSMSVSIQIPDGAREGRYDMTLELRSGNDTSVSAALPVQVIVERPEPPATAAGAPSSLPLILLLLAIAAAGGAIACYLARRGREGRAEPAEERVIDAHTGTGAKAAGAGEPQMAEAVPLSDGWEEAPEVARAPMTGDAGEGAAPGGWGPPSTTASSAASGSSEPLSATAPATPAREPEPWETCLWCFNQLGREPSMVCPSCGGAFHRRCASGARRCTRCGGGL